MINTTDPTLLKTIPALMTTKANIMAYGTVFKWAAFFVFIGGISALFVKENKQAAQPAEHQMEM